MLNSRTSGRNRSALRLGFRSDRAINWRRFTGTFERLEPRMLLAAGDVLSSRNGSSNTNIYPQETVLTPTNVTTAAFGKIFDTTLDGQVYAQPLVKTNVTITTGAAPQVRNVVYVATMHDSLYALDANSGAIFWQDSFTGSTIVPRLSGETVTTLPNSDVQSSTIAPEIGILSTPVIDPASNLLFLFATTKESRYKNPANQALGFDTHYIQRMYAVNLSSGAVVRQTIVGDTIFNSTNFSSDNGYQYVAGAVLSGTGNNGTVTVGGTPTQFTDGWIQNASGYSPQEHGQIAFNALLQLNRPGLTLLNGVIYLGFASHGDKGPYYGWLLGYRTSDLANVVSWITVPNHEDIIGNSNYTAQAGLWTGGAPISTDGTYLYVATGNGTFDPSAGNFDPNYFTMDGPNKVVLPLDNDYGNTILKLLPDPTVVQTQNGSFWTNGNGLRVVDYFTPTNVFVLNELDLDLNSSTPTILPDGASVTISGVTYNHLMIAGGKEGRIYLIDRDNMGGFNYDTGYPFTDDTAPFVDPKLYDRVLGEYAAKGINGIGSGGGNFRMIGSAAYLNNEFYIALSNSTGLSFNLQQFAYASLPNPQSSVPPNPTPDHTTSGTSFGSSGGNLSLSANGTSNVIAWALNVNQRTTSPFDSLNGYNTSLASPIYNSSADATKDILSTDINGNTVSSATGVKFSVPTISNGLVYAGTGSGTSSTIRGTLVAYGLNTLTLATPTNLSAQAVLNGKKIHLAWTRNTTLEAETLVERSTDGTNWLALFNLPNGANSFDEATVVTGTHYFYRVTGINGVTKSTASATANTTLNYIRGDFDLDGAFTSADVAPMLAALTDLNSYVAARSLSNSDLLALGDYTADGLVNNRDIQPLLDAAAAAGSGASALENQLQENALQEKMAEQPAAGPTAVAVQPMFALPINTTVTTMDRAKIFGQRVQPQSDSSPPLTRKISPNSLHASEMFRSRHAVGGSPSGSMQLVDELLANWM